MLASNKCQQLARALLSSAMKISYEDVQTITTYIAQCATNVLTVTVEVFWVKLIVGSHRQSMDPYKDAQIY